MDFKSVLFSKEHMVSPFKMNFKNKEISIEDKKIKTIALSILVGIFTAGIGGIILFYCLSAKYKIEKLNGSDDDLSNKETQNTFNKPEENQVENEEDQVENEEDQVESGKDPFLRGDPKHNFTKEEIGQWLFNRELSSLYPTSRLLQRNQQKYAPKTNFENLSMISQQGKGKYSSRMAIHSGGITDIKATQGESVAVGDSNNGDLLTGCGYAVAKAIINAAGPSLQTELYNKFGVPKVMEVPEGAVEYTQRLYGGKEGRGYALTCNSYDMNKSHGIAFIEFMTVPMHDVRGVQNMYKMAYEHSKNLDWIILPMAGMSHPVLENNPKLSADIATKEFKKFVDANPDSKLKVVFTIFENKSYENYYRDAALELDTEMLR